MAFNPTLTLPTSSQWTNTMAPRIGQTRGPIDVWAGHQNMSVSRLTADDMRSTFTRNNVSMITNLPTASTLSKKPEDNWNRFITPYVPIFVLRNRVDRVRVDPLDMRPGQDSQFEHYSYALPLLCMNSFLTRHKCNAAQRELAKVMQAQKESPGWGVRISGGGGGGGASDEMPGRFGMGARIGDSLIGHELDGQISKLKKNLDELKKKAADDGVKMGNLLSDQQTADKEVMEYASVLEEARSAQKAAIDATNSNTRALEDQVKSLQSAKKLQEADVTEYEIIEQIDAATRTPEQKTRLAVLGKTLASYLKDRRAMEQLIQNAPALKTAADAAAVRFTEADRKYLELKAAATKARMSFDAALSGNEQIIELGKATAAQLDALNEQRRRDLEDRLAASESDKAELERRLFSSGAPESSTSTPSVFARDPYGGLKPPSSQPSSGVTTPEALSEDEELEGRVDTTWNPDKHDDDKLSEFQIEQYVRLQEHMVSDSKASYSVKFGPVAHQLESMRYLTPKLIMQQITYMGIQGTQANLIEDVNKTEGGMNLSADGAPPVLSLVMRSMTYAMNIWPGAYTGQQLWFLLKRVQLDAPTPEQVRSDPAKQELPRDLSKWSHFQFVPYVSRGLSKHVEYEDTLYLGYGGQIEQAYVIHVGEASIEPTKVDKWDKNQSLLAAGVHTRSSLNKTSTPLDNGAPTVFEAAYANNELGTIKLVVNPTYLGDMAMTHC